MNLLPRLIPGLAVLTSALALFAGEPGSSDPGGTVKVNVVVDMTDAGRKSARPSPESPVYYLPLPSGYREVGYARFYQRPLPPAPEVEKFMERQFAGQGYRVLAPGTHPTLVLELAWGYMSPTVSGTIDRHAATNVPPEWIATLLYGDTADTIGFDGKPRDYRLDDLDQLISEHRGLYFVVVSAFDFQDWLRHRVTLLWRAHVSTPMWGRYFDEVLPTMVTAAAPWLGRETLRPALSLEPLVPPGHVIVGAPGVKNLP